jgi:hypothetical protein
MQTLLGFYVTPEAQMRAPNGKALGLFVESYFTQAGLGREHLSLLEMKPDIDKALASRFGNSYYVTFFDADLQQDADRDSINLILFVNTLDVHSTQIH